MANQFRSKLGKVLARTDIVVIAQDVEMALTRIDDRDDDKITRLQFPTSKTHNWLNGLKVLHVLALTDKVQPTTRNAAIKMEGFRIQVISSMEFIDNNVFLERGHIYLLFLYVSDSVTDHVKKHNPDTLENMKVVDGARSAFEFGTAYEYQREIQKESFRTVKMADLAQTTARFCELMKKGSNSTKELEELSKDPRYIYSSIAKQILEIPENSRTPFIYTNSKLPVLPADKPARNPDIPEKLK